MNIFTNKFKGEPIRESLALLVMKLATTILLFDFIYSAIFYILNIVYNLPHDLHHSLSFVFFILLLTKASIQAVMIIYAVLTWSNNIFYLTDNQLVRKRGILNIHEDLIDLKNIRSISVNQTIIGKLCNYGEVVLETSAAGGYHTSISLEGVTNPKAYKKMFENVFENHYVYLSRK